MNETDFILISGYSEINSVLVVWLTTIILDANLIAIFSMKIYGVLILLRILLVLLKLCHAR